MTYTVKDILRMEVKPALGCTEPAAVALCMAAASSLLKGKVVDRIELWVDPNIYKNAMGVTIPVTSGQHGIDMAAAIGALAGDPSLRLEVFDRMNENDVIRAKEFVAKKKVSINLLKQTKGIFIHAKIHSEANIAEAIIENTHDNITTLILNNSAVEKHPLLTEAMKLNDDLQKLERWLTSLSLNDLVKLAEGLDKEDVLFIEEGMRCNIALSDHGLQHGSGLGIGLTLERLVAEGLLKKDMILQARIMTAAASDARMSGVKLPAMSSAGSGNHGLTAILPICAVNRFLKDSDVKRLYRAIALSHVITAYIKAHTGRLSAICGCSVAAGAGATGGITYLMNGTTHHISGAIKNLIGDLAGIICDGAKAGCSLKLATAAGTAVQSALLALHGIDVKATDGIIADTSEQTMKNIGELSTKGMIDTDRTILDIMIKKKFGTQSVKDETN